MSDGNEKVKDATLSSLKRKIDGAIQSGSPQDATIWIDCYNKYLQSVLQQYTMGVEAGE